MNVCGPSVNLALRHFKIDKSNMIVLHDELEKKLGNVRVVKGTSFK